MKKILIALFMCLMMIGCSKPEPIIETKTEYVTKIDTVFVHDTTVIHDTVLKITEADTSKIEAYRHWDLKIVYINTGEVYRSFTADDRVKLCGTSDSKYDIYEDKMEIEIKCSNSKKSLARYPKSIFDYILEKSSIGFTFGRKKF